MKREDNLLFIVLLLALVGGFLVFIFDNAIILFIASFRGIYLDYILLSIAFTANVFIVLFFLMVLFLWNKDKKKWVFPLIFSVIFSFIISFILKVAVHRPRPFVILGPTFKALTVAFYFMKDNYNTWNFAFPSFEAIFIFATVPIFSKSFKKFRHIWFAFACLVAFSRVYFGVHYLSDVIFGAIIGYIIGYVFVLIEERAHVGEKLMNLLN